MAERRRRRRPGLGAALIGFAVLGGSGLVGSLVAEAQTPPASGSGAPAATGGSAGTAGSAVRLPGALNLPGSAPDASRFWLPQLYPDFPQGPGATGAPGPLWSIQRSIELQGVATDNVANSTGGREGDLYTIIRPRVALVAQSARLVGSFSYAPSARFYLNNSDQNRVDHALAAQGTATLIEDLMFLDVTGSSDAQSVFGNFGQFGNLGTDGFGRNERVQTTTYRISPYLVRRFGGIASARLGYAFGQGLQGGSNGFAAGQTQPFFTPQDQTYHEIYGSVTSGEDWGRLGFDLQASRREFDGSGVYDGAHRHLYVLALRYQLTREFALTGDIGWQDERYAGVVPLVIQEPVWGLGFRFTPDPDSYINVRYGQRDGVESWTVDAGIMVGVRTRLILSYDERLGAPFGPNGGLPAGVRVDDFGNIVDAQTGLPIALSDLQLLAQQNAITRTRRGTAALSQVWPRDTLTLALTREEREPVAVPQGSSALAQDTTSLAIAWSRELEPGLSLSTAARGGVTETEGSGDGRFYSVQAALARAFSPTLAGTLQYQFTMSDNTAASSGRSTQNTVIVSLRQLF